MTSDQIRSIPIFAHLNSQESEELVKLLTARTLSADEPLFWLGDKGEDFFVIQQGRIRLTFPDQNGNDIELATLSAGDVLGEISLLDGGPRTATARAALVGTTVLSLTREQFLNFLEEHPKSAIHLLATLGKRQRNTVDRLRGLRNVNEIIHEQETTWNKVAAAIASAAASKAFLVTHATVFVGWVVINLIVGGYAPDPFPFMFLASFASCEGMFLALFILVSQNVQTRKDRLRMDVEYQVALKMQLEIMQLHQKIDRAPQDTLELLLDLLQKRGMVEGREDGDEAGVSRLRS